MKRNYFPDEEPDFEDRFLPLHEWQALVADLCPLCGHSDHKKKDCKSVQPWMLRQDD